MGCSAYPACRNAGGGRGQLASTRPVFMCCMHALPRCRPVHLNAGSCSHMPCWCHAIIIAARRRQQYARAPLASKGTSTVLQYHSSLVPAPACSSTSGSSSPPQRGPGQRYTPPAAAGERQRAQRAKRAKCGAVRGVRVCCMHSSVACACRHRASGCAALGAAAAARQSIISELSRDGREHRATRPGPRTCCM